MKGNYLELTFQIAAYASEWDSAFEQVRRLPWLFRNFVTNLSSQSRQIMLHASISGRINYVFFF